MTITNEHGGALRHAVDRYGGAVADWMDLSTGINPISYPIPELTTRDFNALPDPMDIAALEDTARRFWNVPDAAEVVCAPGASALIARMPDALSAESIDIPEPTYNEHRAAFERKGVPVTGNSKARVLVHPNNPDGRFWSVDDTIHSEICVIDESFCDLSPSRSLIELTRSPGRVILKSFGKFWGLAGLRLGFAIGDPDIIERLRRLLGPWPVSGPAVRVGLAALSDFDWVDAARARLARDAARLETLMEAKGHKPVGGTDLFRLYETDADKLRRRLANSFILCRTFSYADNWVRLGLPGDPVHWDRLEAAL